MNVLVARRFVEWIGAHGGLNWPRGSGSASGRTTVQRLGEVTVEPNARMAKADHHHPGDRHRPAAVWYLAEFG